MNIKYRVPYNTWAGGTITVETDETDPEKIIELAYEEGIPFLCHQCSGSNMSFRNSSLEIGDEWEVSLHESGPLKGQPMIYLDETGKAYVPPEVSDEP